MHTKSSFNDIGVYPLFAVMGFAMGGLGYFLSHMVKVLFYLERVANLGCLFSTKNMFLTAKTTMLLGYPFSNIKLQR